MNLQDSWCHSHPTTRLFTYTSNVNSMSCLDRIYTSATHETSLSDWKSHQCPIPTDHNLVSTHFAPPGLPHIRKGRWTWPLSLLLIKSTEEWGIKLQIEIGFRNTVKVMLKGYQIWRALASACMLCPFPKYCPVFQKGICIVSEDPDGYSSISEGKDKYCSTIQNAVTITLALGGYQCLCSLFPW
jgi:hypothetical protein